MSVRCFVMYSMMYVASCLCSPALAAPVDDPCPKTSMSRVWSADCLATTPAGRQVKKQYLKQIILDRKGYAAIVVTPPAELLSVNRSGRVLPLERAHLGDFDFAPGDGEGDIVQFGYLAKKGGSTTVFKCGYYRTGKHFEVLVPPVYDHCDAFKEGRALVCLDCTNHCEGGDCHETDFIGGEGLVIDQRNQVLKRFALPLLPLCSNDSSDGKCRPRPADPFSTLK
jgi:hypothetical protein